MNKEQFRITKFNCDYARTLLDKVVHQGENEHLGFAVLTLWKAVDSLVKEQEGRTPSKTKAAYNKAAARQIKILRNEIKTLKEKLKNENT